MSYHQFTDNQGNSLGSFETFKTYGLFDQGEEPLEPGWYWWSCFPGCLPDGEPSGPFSNEQEALKDATDFI